MENAKTVVVKSATKSDTKWSPTLPKLLTEKIAGVHIRDSRAATNRLCCLRGTQPNISQARVRKAERYVELLRVEDSEVAVFDSTKSVTFYL